MASDKNKQTPKSSVALPAPSMDLEIHFFCFVEKNNLPRKQRQE